MREIKYRAYVDYPAYGKGVFRVKSISFIPLVIEVIIGHEVVNFFDFDDIKLLQYTGLTDKDGKEIYEGDLVKLWENKTQEVVFEKQGFWLKKGEEKCPLWNESEDLEIIGNVYENPELI